MDGIRVGFLLRADRKVQGLERESLAAIKRAEQVQHRLVGGDGADILVELPGVLDAPFPNRLVAVRIGEIDAVARAEMMLDAGDTIIEVGIGEVEDGIALFMQIIGDPLFLRAQPPFRLERRKKGRFD